MTDPTATILRSAEPVAIERTPLEATLERIRERVAFVGPAISAVVKAGAVIGRRVARVTSPVLGLVAPLGWLSLLLGIALLIAGFATGWRELVLVGAPLVAAVVVAFAFIIGRSTYTSVVELEPARVTVGERALGRILITNTGTRPVPAGRIELPVGDGRVEVTVPSLAVGAGHEDFFGVPTARRAVIVAGPAIAIRGDQIGLVRRLVRTSDPVELFVHPKVARLAPSAAGLVHDLEGFVTRKLSNSDMSFHALRDYVPGDDHRYVHWKSVARTGQLLVRQFEETRRSHLTILHVADQRAYATEDEFELAVSVTASIATQVVGTDSELSVVSDRIQLSTRSTTAVLDDASRLQVVPPSYASPREFARETTKRLPPPTVLVIVTGSGTEAADLRAMHAVFGPEVRTFAFRAHLDGKAGVAPLPGMLVATITDLGELRGLIRKVTSR